MEFYKFDGAGNDFVLIDIRDNDPQLSSTDIATLCHRRFGVGADGLMTLGHCHGYDFEMHYYNADGGLGSMCGNGGRCIAAFAMMLGLGKRQEGKTFLHFKGYDGPHDAVVLQWDGSVGVVDLGMKDVPTASIRRCLEGWSLDTGSPHYVQYVQNLAQFDVVGEGRRLRSLTETFPEGTNVDFIERQPDGTLHVRTYERGVEDETWACGTGVTACAIVSGIGHIKALGGSFNVSFECSDNAYTHVHLVGPVACNFKGSIDLSALSAHRHYPLTLQPSYQHLFANGSF